MTKQCRFPTTQECYERPCANCIPSDKLIAVDTPAADEIDALRWVDEMDDIESDWHNQVTELRGGG